MTEEGWRIVTLIITKAEAISLSQCISGELESDDGLHGEYMRDLGKVQLQLDERLHKGGVDTE